MSKGPVLFADIGKKAKDLLTKDYNSDQKFSVSTNSDAGVALTSTAVKKGGLSTGDVAALYMYKNTTFDVKFDTGSNISTTLTFTDFLPSTKTIASIKFPDYNSGKVPSRRACGYLFSFQSLVEAAGLDWGGIRVSSLFLPWILQLEVQYFHDRASFTTAVALNQSPSIDVTATIGTPTIAFGAEAGYDTTLGSLTKYTAGISVTKPDSYASMILGDKGDSLQASYVHHLDLLKKSSVAGEITRRFSTNENTFTIGGSFPVDHLTVVKAKLNNHGKLGAVVQHEVIPKSVLTISSEVDTKALDKSPRFGLAIALKP
uniref:Uncharacterized protein n=1 Tax=Salix viminalis TaxID=40686 RepID=A0A6N2L691_SALVM